MPDPIEVKKFRMEQMGMKQKDLAEVVGYKTRVSEILSKKHELTLGMIRKLNSTLHIPTEVMVQDYNNKRFGNNDYGLLFALVYFSNR